MDFSLELSTRKLGADEGPTADKHGDLVTYILVLIPLWAPYHCAFEQVSSLFTLNLTVFNCTVYLWKWLSFE